MFTNLKPNTVGERIFKKPLIRDDISFDLKKAQEKSGGGENDKDKDSQINQMLGTSGKKKPGKYFVSQEPNWGPKARAMGGVHKSQKKEESETDKK